MKRDWSEIKKMFAVSYVITICPMVKNGYDYQMKYIDNFCGSFYFGFSKYVVNMCEVIC